MHNSIQTPLSRTARLLDLVPYVASHQGIEIETLAQNFNVTQAQMISDLTTLWMCGLPGYTHLELMDLSFDSGFVTGHFRLGRREADHLFASADRRFAGRLMMLEVWGRLFFQGATIESVQTDLGRCASF